MSEKQVTNEDVKSALANLKKGLKGSGNTTPVTGSASGVGAPSQIHHMPDSSAVTSHAGTTTEKLDTLGNEPEYSPNGTDVNYGSIAKSVLELISAGKMTAAEGMEFLKGMPWLEGKGPKTDKDPKDESKAGDKEDDKKDKKDAKVEKSLEDIAAENADVADGIDVSAFLKGFVESISKALIAQSQHQVAVIVGEIQRASAKQEGFSKSLVGAMEVIGDGLTTTNARIEQVESAPAAAPKSQTVSGNGILAKSITGETVNLGRQEILNAMVELVTIKKSLNDGAIVKFESTGEISDKVMKQVIAHIQGK